jgi:hypothetical protein
MPIGRRKLYNQAALDAANRNLNSELVNTSQVSTRMANERSSHISLVGQQIVEILEFAEANEWLLIQPFAVITGYVRRRPQTTQAAGWLLDRSHSSSTLTDYIRYRVLLSDGDIGHSESQNSTEIPPLTTQSYQSLLGEQGHTTNTEHRLDADLRRLAANIGAPVIIP